MRKNIGPVVLQVTWDWREIGLGIIVSLRLRMVEVYVGPLEAAVWPRRQR